MHFLHFSIKHLFLFQMGWQISRLFAPLPNDMNSSELRILLAVISEKEFHIQRIAFTNAEGKILL